MENNNTTEEISWEIPEYIKHERSKNWYIGALSVATVFLLYAIFTQNVLFAGIIVIGAFVMYLNDKSEPVMLRVVLGDEGIVVGDKFHDYDEIRNFSVLYKPSQDLNHLYIEFKAAVKQRLSINLMGQDPLAVRQFLLRYLPEDLERINRPTSETLAKILKL